MLPLAVATSIDALAVGVSFAFLQVQHPASAVSWSSGVDHLRAVGVAGVKIGNLFGAQLRSPRQSWWAASF